MTTPIRTPRFATAVCGGMLLLACWLSPCSLSAQTVSSPPPKVLVTKKLDGPTRAKMIAAIGGLVILGFGIVTLVWLGGRMTRRIMKEYDHRKWLTTEDLTSDDWADKPLTSEERERILNRPG